MLNKLSNLFFKIFLFIQRKYFLNKYESQPGFYVFNKESKIKTVIFDLSNAKYTHIGDSLFYEPIIQQLKKFGVKIDVCVNKNIFEYFKNTGHKVVNSDLIDKYDLIIAPFWLFNIYSNKKKIKSLFLDPSNFKIDEPITDYFYKNICLFLKIPFKNEILSPTIPNFNSLKLKLDKNEKYIVYNDSIDSGFWGITRKMRKTLEYNLKNCYKMGFKIIRVSSVNDKIKNPESLSIEHLDLRGQTKIQDVFELIGHPSVIGTISFDTAIAHISLMYKKKTKIMIRRFSEEHKKHIKNYILPSYKSDERNKIEYIK